jgi:hypothetical protein
MRVGFGTVLELEGARSGYLASEGTYPLKHGYAKEEATCCAITDHDPVVGKILP